MGVANFNFNFLSHFCINFQNLCGHHQEEILRFPKHPQKSSFWWVLAEKTAKNKVAPKIEYQKYFRKTLSSLEHHNLASDLSNWASRGCFGIVKTSSWRWAQRFFKLMHLSLSNALKTILLKLWCQLYNSNIKTDHPDCNCIVSCWCWMKVAVWAAAWPGSRAVRLDWPVPGFRGDCPVPPATTTVKYLYNL